MIKSKLLLGVIFLIMMVLVTGACAKSNTETQTPSATVPDKVNLKEVTREQGRQIAGDFVKSSPTFVFDGIADSLKLLDSVSLSRCQYCWGVTYEFESSHAGYGDRTGQILAQVITTHQVTIVVEQGEVNQARMDNKWDMVSQKMMEPEQPIGVSVDASYNGKEVEVPVGQSLQVNLESNPSTGFGWAIREITNQTVIEEISNKFAPSEQTEPPKVGVGGTEAWLFRALKQGKSTITMVYSRIWESIPPAETFVLTVNVIP